ncbi:hypothetical protein [Denitrobaculum tricleocarpae]|uniref:Uncharacterized protein n=1 Tax=Denitrobaculum tricleocarpae TaxID=2591009 RepID=A0A545TL00_9PROT|nr:hypothetical protein [Denitrobaculum tricleocarpae]TQV77902.1 hypothetical protein FKG95_20385 [Denitrobaculum tricleocarpae]
MHLEASELEVEPSAESGGHCDCCGKESRSINGYVHIRDAETVACYFMHWTVGASLATHPANFDLIYGPWGEGISKDHRCAISLIYFENDDGPTVRVIDANDRPVASYEFVGTALTREEVIGTPLAADVFAIFDAVFLQDERVVKT